MDPRLSTLTTESGAFLPDSSKDPSLFKSKVDFVQEYIHLPSPILSRKQGIQLFHNTHSLYLDILANPLQECRFPQVSQYSPHTPFDHAGLASKRIELLKRLGYLANCFESNFGQIGAIWSHLFIKVREQYPNKRENVNLHLTKQSFVN